MPRKSEFRIDNFSLGMRRDGAMTQDRMYALRTLKNCDIDYTDGRLVVRKGYSRWNAVALPYPANQLYWFGDMDGNENLLGVVGNPTYAWYKIAETGAHTRISAHAATTRRPAMTFGNRVLFGTDKDATEEMAGGNGFQWADNTSIVAGTSYRVGIKKPTEGPTVYNVDAEGKSSGLDAPALELNDDSQRKFGLEYTPAVNLVVGSVRVSMQRANSDYPIGNIRARIETDSAGSASGTLADDNAISDWVSISQFTKAASYGWILFKFPKVFTLSASTKYHIVIIGDEAYYNFWTHADATGVIDFNVALGRENAPGSWIYGATQIYSQSGSSWSATTSEGLFYVSGLTETGGSETGYYDYIITYYNSDYGIESRKSEYTRVKIAAAEMVYVMDYPAPSDGQVDKIRIYRRKLAADATGSESDDDIAALYYFVTEIDNAQAFYDTIPDTLTGAVLQTNNHYCLDETDDEGTKLREEEIHPNIAVLWKGRVWVAETDGNKLYMSKKLEEDGASGLTGGLIPDYFPLENVLEVGCPSGIVNVEVLPTNELVVYFANSTIWVVSGANDIQNPPSDMSIAQRSGNIGLIASVAVDNFRGRHVLLSRHGLYAFNGTPNLEKLSVYIQSILDDITDANIDDSIVTTFGDEVWLLVDSDNDGSLDSVYILDIGQNPITWRIYNYGVTLNDLIVREVGTEYKTLFAADKVNKYVLKLNTGTADNDEDITAMIETHPLRSENRSSLFDVFIGAYYPSTVPTYTITITDHSGNETEYTLSPTSSEDIRGHHIGVRVTSDPEARVAISHDTQLADELLFIEIGYIERG